MKLSKAQQLQAQLSLAQCCLTFRSWIAPDRNVTSTSLVRSFGGVAQNTAQYPAFMSTTLRAYAASLLLRSHRQAPPAPLTHPPFPFEHGASIAVIKRRSQGDTRDAGVRRHVATIFVARSKTVAALMAVRPAIRASAVQRRLRQAGPEAGEGIVVGVGRVGRAD